ncbi:MAG: hypothetical protein ACKO37_08600 [Vampirovibrionales bacterium]
MGKWLQALKEERAKLSALEVETSEKNKNTPLHPVPKVSKPPFGTFDTSPHSPFEKNSPVSPADVHTLVCYLMPKGFVSTYTVAIDLNWQVARVKAVALHLKHQLWLLEDTSSIALNSLARGVFTSKEGDQLYRGN